MTRIALFGVSVVLLSTWGLAAEPAKTEAPAVEAAPSKPLEQRLRESPNDVALWNQYITGNARQLAMLVRLQPDEARKRIDAVKALLSSLQPTEDEAKKMLAQANAIFGYYEQRLLLMKMTREEIEAKLNAAPDDAATISLYGQKVSMELSPLASSEPEKAEQSLTAAKKFLEGLRAKAKDDAVKQILDRVDQALTRVQSAIDRAKRLAALVGMDAAPLNVEGWVNGAPLTDADLKGKVVLLDFWAVWCGPCISTFPHLREWQKEYSEQGLVIVGLTNYYNCTWDEAAKRATRVRGEEKVPPEKEREMLVQFAAHHELLHRFAIQKDRSLSDYYAVYGIPHVVVIDRKGKIRLIRIGSTEKNAQDIHDMLKKLLAESV